MATLEIKWELYKQKPKAYMRYVQVARTHEEKAVLGRAIEEATRHCFASIPKQRVKFTAPVPNIGHTGFEAGLNPKPLNQC